MAHDEVGYMFNAQSEISEQAQRALDLKGELPLRLVDPHAQLSLTVDDWTQPEYRYLRRNMLTSYRMGIAAVAAQFGCMQLGNTVNGATVIVVEKVLVSNLTAAAQLVQLFLTATAGPNSINTGAQQRDDRLRQTAPLGGGSGVLLGGTTAAPPTGFGGQMIFSIPAGQMITFDFPWVITGLNFFTICSGTLNSAVEATLITRERALLSPER